MRTNLFRPLPAALAAAAAGVAVGVLATAPALVRLAGRAARAEDLASRDPLTGIAHRQAARSRFDRSRLPQDVLLLDLDGFKEINDTLGHDAGDQVIQAIASRLDLWARPHGALAARLGGDEFLILHRHRGPAEAIATARALRDLVALPVAVTGPDRMVPVRPSASIGLSLPGHGRSWPARLRTADIALYQAKRAQPPITVFAPGMAMPATAPGIRLRDLPAAREGS